MLVLNDVTQKVNGRLHPIANYIVAIANIYIQHHGHEQDLKDFTLSNADIYCDGDTAVDWRTSFLEACTEDHGPVSPNVQALIMAYALPGPPVQARVRLALPRAVYAAEIDRLADLRAQSPPQNGTQLAQAAINMAGWFHWVSSGPKVPNMPGQFGGEFFMPRVSWTHTQTNNGFEVHDRKYNDFAAWLLEPQHPEPDQHAFMNCWEAVLFSAYRAGLVNHVQLKMIHRKAGICCEIHDRLLNGSSIDHYGDAVSQSLNFIASVPYVPRAGLIPRKGDILFWNKNEHVAISLGRSTVKGIVVDRAMSLWHNNHGTFAQLSFTDMHTLNPAELRFVPCPF